MADRAFDFIHGHRPVFFPHQLDFLAFAAGTDFQRLQAFAGSIPRGLVVDVVFVSGLVFVMEAGGVENDSFAAIYALAAVDLAVRGWKQRQVTDLWLSLVATALVTGAKQTNIPLALPCLIAVIPGVRLLRSRPGITASVLVVCILVSNLPICFFNLKHYGQCFPLNIPGEDYPQNHYHINSPFWGVVGNMFTFRCRICCPPFFLMPNSGIK